MPGNLQSLPETMDSYNMKGIAPPPVHPVQCCTNKNLMSGCAAPTLKRVGEGGWRNVSGNGILQSNACDI